MTEETNSGGHSAMCLRLMRVFPRVMRGMRRYQDQTTPQTTAPLGPRHVAALEQLREGPLSVGTLADRLGLTLSTVSGVLAGLDRAGFVERTADQADRRRTIVQIAPDAGRSCRSGWMARPRRWPGSSTSSAVMSVLPSSRPWTCSKPNSGPATARRRCPRAAGNVPIRTWS